MSDAYLLILLLGAVCAPFILMAAIADGIEYLSSRRRPAPLEPRGHNKGPMAVYCRRASDKRRTRHV